jgi:hypothetical protein
MRQRIASLLIDLGNNQPLLLLLMMAAVCLAAVMLILYAVWRERMFLKSLNRPRRNDQWTPEPEPVRVHAERRDR